MNDEQAAAWRAVIFEGTAPEDVWRVVKAINDLFLARRVNGGAVIVACAQILAQAIVASTPDCAAQSRSGIVALIDGFATQMAVGDEP